MNDPVAFIAIPPWGAEVRVTPEIRRMLKTHPRRVCRAGPVKTCVIHNQSRHNMRGWPLNIRLDRNYALAERICPHGTGHPDPDSMAFIVSQMGPEKASYEAVHGCDGCCRAGN